MDRIDRVIRRAVRRRAEALNRGDSKAAQSALRVARRYRAVRRAQHPGRTVGFDGVPVMKGLALVLQEARDAGVKFRLNSADRRKGVAERYGKLSQAALWAGWVAHKLGFNPANPPGRSTHELRSDGVAYRGPVGRPLSWWQLGLDIEGAGDLMIFLNRRGYSVRRPYRSNSERHHLNFTRNPRANYLRRNA